MRYSYLLILSLLVGCSGPFPIGSQVKVKNTNVKGTVVQYCPFSWSVILYENNVGEVIKQEFRNEDLESAE